MKQSGNTNLLPSTLHQQVDTRWCSHFKMLKSIHCRFSAIEELLESKGEAARISNIDIEILTELLSFLEPFTVATRELESDTLPTVPFIVPWLYSLKNHCMNEDGGPEIRPLKTRALEYLLKKI